MGLEALALALVLGAASAAGSALAIGAWTRTRDARFLLLAAAQWSLLVMGAIWALGQILASPPLYARAELPEIGLSALCACLLVLGSIVPRSHKDA